LLSGCTPKTHEIAACTPGDNVFCGINGPEDMEIVPGTRWLLSTGAHDKVRMVLFDPKTREIKPLLATPPVPTETETFPRCGDPPPAIGTGSIHLSTAEDGSLRLLEDARGTVAERSRLARRQGLRH
jgi:hypothetical protein